MRTAALFVALVAVVVRPAAAQAPGPDSYLRRLAIELGAERDPSPILLGPDRDKPLAAAYDRFTLAHLVARVAANRGAPLDPANPPRDLLLRQLVVVALPMTCGDRIVRPTDVNIDSSGQPISKWLPVSGTAMEKFLPGVTPVPGMIAVQFSATGLTHGAVVRISYADVVCSGSSRQASVTIAATEPRIFERPLIEMPPEQPAPVASITLTLAGVIDLDGRIRYASAPEATTPFGKAALAAASRMKFDPARLNGSPVPWTAGVIVTFGAAAAPAAVAGASTPDAAGLIAASSKCESSSDDTYGRFVSRAIRIGGRTDGHNRIKQYLNVLRGPAGQGIRYEFSGPVMMGGKLIEGVEVRHDGLAEFERLYFDTTAEDRLIAPKGFTCTAPLVVK